MSSSIAKRSTHAAFVCSPGNRSVLDSSESQFLPLTATLVEPSQGNQTGVYLIRPKWKARCEEVDPPADDQADKDIRDRTGNPDVCTDPFLKHLLAWVHHNTP